MPSGRAVSVAPGGGRATSSPAPLHDGGSLPGAHPLSCGLGRLLGSARPKAEPSALSPETLSQLFLEVTAQEATRGQHHPCPQLCLCSLLACPTSLRDAQSDRNSLPKAPSCREWPRSPDLTSKRRALGPANPLPGGSPDLWRSQSSVVEALPAGAFKVVGRATSS